MIILYKHNTKTKTFLYFKIYFVCRSTNKHRMQFWTIPSSCPWSALFNISPKTDTSLLVVWTKRSCPRCSSWPAFLFFPQKVSTYRCRVVFSPCPSVPSLLSFQLLHWCSKSFFSDFVASQLGLQLPRFWWDLWYTLTNHTTGSSQTLELCLCSHNKISHSAECHSRSLQASQAQFC